jgi:hypothetical protein
MNVDGSASTNIVSYRIFYGTTATNLTETVQVSGGTSTSAIISGLPAGTYYFSAVAVNSSGEVSDRTNVVSRTVP